MEVLAEHDSRTLKQLTCNVDCVSLEKHLDLPFNIGIIREDTASKKRLYANTRKGTRTVFSFNQTERQAIFAQCKIYRID
jgi:hypothetical protein